MKYYTHILSLILSAAFLFQACSYLDVVPDETPDEKDAFQNPTMAERYLYSCYSFLPNPRHETASLDTDDVRRGGHSLGARDLRQFPEGNYNASEPVISYWNTLFGGIRRCYILLENIDAVPNMTEANLRIYKGEAKFLIAYYHFLLLKNYGGFRLSRASCPSIWTRQTSPSGTVTTYVCSGSLTCSTKRPGSCRQSRPPRPTAGPRALPPKR
ncbi:MAG: RagB/SusD family nutrient uptake outer membrane protein [Alistipes finegoldii]